jgi:hypothetical protein
MELVGLEQFFQLPGAFGHESHERRDLLNVQPDRINKYLQVELLPEQFIVIGDTQTTSIVPGTLALARFAVGTGRFYSTEELLACKPDAWIEDLSDPELVVKIVGSVCRALCYL